MDGLSSDAIAVLVHIGIAATLVGAAALWAMGYFYGLATAAKQIRPPMGAGPAVSPPPPKPSAQTWFSQKGAPPGTTVTVTGPDGTQFVSKPGQAKTTEGRRWHRLPANLAQQIQDRVANGETSRAIAADLGVSDSVVRRWAKRSLG